jgi:HlyD family secretion protein
MFSSKRIFVQMIGLAAAAIVLASCSAITPTQDTSAAATLQTAPVRTITSVTTATGSGSTVAVQSVSVYWKSTNGQVGTVNVKPGDQVKAGDVLMGLDLSAQPQVLIQAQSDLSTSVKALNTLLHPDALTIANADQLVVKDQNAVKTAQQALDNLNHPNLTYYQDQLRNAQDSAMNAQQNSVQTQIGQQQISLRNAENNLTTATNVYNNAKDAFAQCPTCLTVYAYNRMVSWSDAVNLYTDAVNQVNSIQIQLDQLQRQNAANVTTTQENLTTAQNNLYSATHPDTMTLTLDQAALVLAQSNLANDQANLNKLSNPDPVDVLAAQAKVANAQAALNGFALKAPVDGEVLSVNFQTGDIPTQTQAAVIIANRSHVRVDALVDESDIGKIKVGNPVTITLNALPDLALPATVTYVDPTGTSSQGLVKYTVRVESTTTDPRVLLNMTATALITTNTKLGALAVPLAAVQYDSTGEYVNVVQADSSLNRVPVQSGDIQGSLITVSGQLKAGDQVEIAQASTTTTTGGGGFGGFGGLFGGGGGGPRP